VPVVDPSDLIENFQAVCSIYLEEESNAAAGLEEWLQRDWEIFSRFDVIRSRALLAEILDDGELVRKRYIPRKISNQATVEKWNMFRDEIQWKNRFFIRHDLDLDRLKVLFKFLEETDRNILNGELYRARVQSSDARILIEDMGKPPAEQARNGRANPVGIPYLYVASTAKTAIAETRPHPGDLLTVAKFEVIEPLKLLNLQYPRKTISPFSLDDGELSVLRYDLDFLCHLGNELSKPILPRVADLEYLPTQYLSEFIKNCEYDGVVFKSSISTGSNIVLFFDSKLRAVDVLPYRVTEVRYEQEIIL
jgi:hypothetical protein